MLLSLRDMSPKKKLEQNIIKWSKDLNFWTFLSGNLTKYLVWKVSKTVGLFLSSINKYQK